VDECKPLGPAGERRLRRRPPAHRGGPVGISGGGIVGGVGGGGGGGVIRAPGVRRRVWKGLAYVQRHVIGYTVARDVTGYNLTQATKVQMALDDVALNI